MLPRLKNLLFAVCSVTLAACSGVDIPGQHPLAVLGGEQFFQSRNSLGQSVLSLPATPRHQADSVELKIQNKRATPLTITHLSFTSDHFFVRGPRTVAAFQTASVKINFIPKAVGLLTDTLTLRYEAGGAAYSLQVPVAAQALPSEACSQTNESAGKFPWGSGNASDPYILCTPAQLAGIGNDPVLLASHFLIGADMNLTSYDASTPEKTLPLLGSYERTGSTGNAFTGVLDGGAHTLTGLVLRAPASTSPTGLIAYGVGATVKNLRITNADVRGNSQVGVVMGIGNDVTLANLIVSGTVLAAGSTFHTGGLVGVLVVTGAGKSASITNSVVNVAVKGWDCVGGLAGHVTSNGGSLSFSNTRSTGEISSETPGLSGSTYGGVIGILNLSGSADLEIADVVSTGNVITGGNWSSAFLGTLNLTAGNPTARIVRSGSTGGITSAGTHIPWAHGSVLGGLVGTAVVVVGSLTIEKSYATGNVSNTNVAGAEGLGGLIGNVVAQNSSTVTVSDSYATGDLSATATLSGSGGLIGTAQRAVGATISISNSYASGGVTGAPLSQSGGFIGRITGPALTLTSAYYDSDANAQATHGGALAGVSGLGAAALALPISYVGWDFASVWQVAPSAGSPSHL